MSNFLGDSPVRVLIKLIVASLIVGAAMSAFGWSPLDVYDGLREALLRLWNMGFGALDRVAGYVVLGAFIVVPAFVVIRLLSLRRR